MTGVFRHRFALPVAPQQPSLAVLSRSRVVFDAASNSGYQTAQSTYSWNHTCSERNRYLTVSVSLLSVAGTTVSSITFDGVALSLIRARSSAVGAVRAEMWGLAAPATGGPKSIVVTLSAAVDSAAGAVSFAGVNQSSSYEAENDSSATNVGAADATVDVTTLTDRCLVVDVVAASDAAITVGSGQTSRNNVTGALGSGAMSTEGLQTPPGAVTMSWTDVGAAMTWVIVGVAIRPTGSAAVIIVSAGAYTVSGQSVALIAARKISVDAAAYTLTGQVVGLSFGHKVPIGTGSYILTGQNVTLLFVRKLAAAVGSYTLTGQAVVLRAIRTLTIAAGTYTLTGQVVRLSTSIAATAGSYILTGQAVVLRAIRTLTIAAGSYALTGKEAALRFGHKVQVDAGGYTLTGQNATLLLARKISAGVGVYALTGQVVSLRAARKIYVLAGAYTLTGKDIGFIDRRDFGSGLYIRLDGRAYIELEMEARRPEQEITLGG